MKLTLNECLEYKILEKTIRINFHAKLKEQRVEGKKVFRLNTHLSHTFTKLDAYTSLRACKIM